MKHRLEFCERPIAFNNNNELDVKQKILKDWYLKDVKLLIIEVEKLQNKNIQFKSKLDKGPCGKCRKEI